MIGVRFYICPACKRLLVTDSAGGPVQHDCANTNNAASTP